MDLPLARQPGQKTSLEGLIRAAKRADVILLRMVGEESYLDGATVYLSETHPQVVEANGAYDLRVPPGGDAAQIVDALINKFTEAGSTCFTCDASEPEWPAPLAAALEARGYQPQTLAMAQLAAYAPPALVDDQLQVIPGRAAYNELHRIYTERYQATGAGSPEDAAKARVDQLDDPRVDLFLARRDRQPVGLTGLLTLGNIGVVLDLFTAPTCDDPAVLNTLASHLVDYCMRAQFEQVIARFDPADSRRPFFESLGFKVVGQYVRYCKQEKKASKEMRK
ncbi:MAG: hypothetical protein WD768_17530 [Phycisphaeraceae bacterium]